MWICPLQANRNMGSVACFRKEAGVKETQAFSPPPKPPPLQRSIGGLHHPRNRCCTRGVGGAALFFQNDFAVRRFV